MTTPAEAESAITERMPHTAAEQVPLESAVGRIIAAAAHAERDQPPFDRVTMDGIAIHYSEFAAGRREFRIAGTQAAGAPSLSLPSAEHCIQIMTGAMMPNGADTVVPVERLTIVRGLAIVSDDARIETGQFVHRRGSDRSQGDTVIEPGTVLGQAEVAVLASAGYSTVRVAGRPRVAVISTGDELVGLEDPLEPYQIRSSNDHAIAAALERHSLAVVSRHRLLDDEAALLDSIVRLHAANDALILSGGVSMGQFDFVPAVLDTLGCELVFHRIEQKPGRPMWFGASHDAKPIFALPGNPVSTLLCMTRYVVPAFRRAAGYLQRGPLEYRLARSVLGPRRLTYFVPVTIENAGDGQPAAVPHPTNTSGDFATLTGTDGFLELPPGQHEHPAGTAGRLYRW